MNATRAVLAASISLAVLAAVQARAGDADVAALPMERTLGIVSFVSGGVGVDEADAFRRAATAYPLELQFARKAQPKDQFLSGVSVTIRYKSGKVLLETTTDGPFLLAKLPAGRYSIQAEHYGVVKRHTVDIRAGTRQKHVFVWTTQDNPRELTMA